MASGDSSAPVTHHWLDTSLGELHYVTAGSGRPVLFLHQTPRSWDEYRDVIPIVASRYRVIGMDSLGFGDSSSPAEPLTIELLARGAVALLDELDIEQVAVVGHHTGGIVGLELGSAYPDRVSALVLSATPFIDQAWRDRVGSAPRIDSVTPSIGGEHIVQLWKGRQPFYPSDRVDLLDRFLIDALRASLDPGAGHAAVQKYRMEEKIATVRAPTVLVRPMADPFVCDEVPILAEKLGARMVQVDGGMIPLPDQLPERFAEIVVAFLDGQAS